MPKNVKNHRTNTEINVTKDGYFLVTITHSLEIADET